MQRFVQTGRNLSPVLRGALFYAGFYGALGLLEPFLNVYFLDLGLNGRQIGLIAMLPPLTQIFYTPLISNLADRYGKRVLLLSLSLAGAAIGSLLLGVPRSFAGVVAVVAIYSLLRAPSGSLGDGLVARMSVKHSIDFGKVRLGGSIGFALCSILFGMFLNVAGFRWLFWAAFIGYLFVSVVSLFLEEQAPVEHRERYSIGIIRQNRVLKTILATSFLVVGAMNMGLVFVGVYMRHLGGGEDMIGLYSGVSAGLELPVMFLSGKIIRRLGGVRSLLVGYTLYGMSFLVAGLAISPLMLLASTLLRGPGFALFMTTTIVLLDQNAGKWSAMTQAINTMGAFGIAPLIGAPLGGLIFDLFGPGKVFLVCSAMILTAIVILYASLIMHRTPKVKGGLG